MSEHSEHAERLLRVANQLEEDIRALEARVSPSFEERIGAARRNQAGLRSEALVHALLHLAERIPESRDPGIPDSSPAVDPGLRARQGFARLLEMFPTAEVLQVNGPPGRSPSGSPWTTVDLSRDGTTLRFAIWNETGNVYRVDEQGGAAANNPIIEVTPL